jgi:hypothetical protein
MLWITKQCAEQEPEKDNDGKDTEKYCCISTYNVQKKEKITTNIETAGKRKMEIEIGDLPARSVDESGFHWT